MNKGWNLMAVERGARSSAGKVTLEGLVEETVRRFTDELAKEPPLAEIDERTAQVDGMM